jgi:hypothetical protein
MLKCPLILLSLELELILLAYKIETDILICVLDKPSTKKTVSSFIAKCDEVLKYK